MKKLLLLLSFTVLFSFEGGLVKSIYRVFSKNSIEIIRKKYGSEGVRAIDRLYFKYGKDSVLKLEKIYENYGKDGVRLVAKYGDEVVRDPTTFNIVKRYGDKGFYLIKRFPKRSVEYYKKFGNKFIFLSERYGASRIIKYLDKAKRYNKEDLIIKFLDRFGDRANVFLDRFFLHSLDSKEVLKEIAKELGENSLDYIWDFVKNFFIRGISSIFNNVFFVFIGVFVLLNYLWKFLKQH